MIIDFKNIVYLKQGNERQQLAYAAIVKHQVLEKLGDYNPILTGTIPIEIDLPESDLDIICHCKDHKRFGGFLVKQFGNETDFKLATTIQNGIEATVATFSADKFEFEIFGQNLPTEKQNAYRHMIIEHRLILKKGNDFKQAIIELKSKGLKTEPAFAKLLGIKGNPYVELLKREDNLN
ncbi:DUF4269 domain-containing protein [Zobellia roscoffensis]|uniref:DUF4269 domain-containing protein n=1 Tax=Zobellia roscoffensis TaxID=2779508 RepID=UPI001D03E86F|nr:DUF4269 domain-containing protein [Zobellia roscoffensis]